MTGEGPPATADEVRFTELALASSRLWRTVRLVRSFRGEDHRPPVRAWIRRPDSLRVEDLGSRLPMSMRRSEAPFFQDYHWVVMLDPYELAVGADLDTGAESPPLAYDEVAEVEHHGRPALQALVRTLPGYDPRCDCCPLLPGADSEARSLEAPPSRSAARGTGTGTTC